MRNRNSGFPARKNPQFDYNRSGEKLTIRILSDLNAGSASYFFKNLKSLITESKPKEIIIDVNGSSGMDDYGALILYDIEDASEKQNTLFKLITDNQETLQYYNDFRESCRQLPTHAKRKKRMGLIERLGDNSVSGVKSLNQIVLFAGDAVLSLFSVFRNPKTFRLDDTIIFMSKTGVDAIPIVALISFLLGLIMAFMSSIQLQQFGANIYVASLVALAMVSELGPIMTAIIVAGRSGSAFAAEIATMKISEEIDALFIMGFDATVFLAVPRIVAACIVVPILSLFSNIFAIAGGLVVGVFMLNLTPSAYIDQTLKTLKLFDVVWGLAKSGVFAALIAWVGCLRGFQARGGASSVGNAATSAVVTSIFLIILFDSAFAVIRSYWR